MDVSAVRLHRQGDVGEAEAKALDVMPVAGGDTEESVEYLLELLALDAAAIVLHADDQVAVIT